MDNNFRRNKLVIGEDIITECAPKLLTKLSMMETLRSTLHPSLAKEMSGHSSKTSSYESDSDDELFSDEE